MENTTFTTMILVNATFTNGNETESNVTTQRPPLPRTPPPPGYYGDVRVKLWEILPPIIMTWGIVGNILSVIILLRLARKTSISSTTLFLIALAMSDTIILLCGPLRNWIKVTWDKDVRYSSDLSCKSQVYFTYFSIHLSSWILVVITMERVISVVLPHKVKIGCTPRNAGIVLFIITIVLGGLSLVHPIIQSLESNRGNLKCSPKTAKHLKFRDDIYIWIDFLLSFGLPFLFLLIGNIVIIYKLNLSRLRRKQMNAVRGDGKSSTGRDMRSLSILLIALSLIFLFTMTPVNIFIVYYPYKFAALLEIKDPYKQWYDYQYLLYQHAIVNLVGYTNASFNFILYVLTGTKFRQEFITMFKCIALRRKWSTMDIMSSSKDTAQSSISATETSSKQNKSTVSETQTSTTKIETVEPVVNTTSTGLAVDNSYDNSGTTASENEGIATINDNGVTLAIHDNTDNLTDVQEENPKPSVTTEIIDNVTDLSEDSAKNITVVETNKGNKELNNIQM